MAVAAAVGVAETEEPSYPFERVMYGQQEEGAFVGKQESAWGTKDSSDEACDRRHFPEIKHRRVFMINVVSAASVPNILVPKTKP